MERRQQNAILGVHVNFRHDAPARSRHDLVDAIAGEIAGGDPNAALEGVPVRCELRQHSPGHLVDHRDELRRSRTLAAPDDDHAAFTVVEVGLVGVARLVASLHADHRVQVQAGNGDDCGWRIVVDRVAGGAIVSVIVYVPSSTLLTSDTLSQRGIGVVRGPSIHDRQNAEPVSGLGLIANVAPASSTGLASVPLLPGDAAHGD